MSTTQPACAYRLSDETLGRVAREFLSEDPVRDEYRRPGHPVRRVTLDPGRPVDLGAEWYEDQRVADAK